MCGSLLIYEYGSCAYVFSFFAYIYILACFIWSWDFFEHVASCFLQAKFLFLCFLGFVAQVVILSVCIVLDAWYLLFCS